MKRLNLFFTLFIGLTISSCSSDEQKNCIKNSTIETDFVVELNIKSSKEIYSDSNFTISISTYTSPNGDGIRDTFFITIKNLNDNTTFNSLTSNNSEEFIASAELKISNECDEIFSTSDINNLTWYPGYIPPQLEGTYNVDLKMTLIDDTNINLKNSFEVLLTSDLP